MKYGYFVGILAALAGGLAAFYRRHYLSRLPESHELDDFLDLPQPVLAPPDDQILPVQPIPKPIPPMPTLKPNMLVIFCTAIRDHEGNPGDANYKNRNPGNFHCSPVGYLPKYGNVRCSPGKFAIFPTYELGWEYLLNSIIHRAARHPQWTIYQFFANYAPVEDQNDPVRYAEIVAARCGVSPQTTLAKLFS